MHELAKPLLAGANWCKIPVNSGSKSSKIYTFIRFTGVLRFFMLTD
jgi:hypothetical protein